MSLITMYAAYGKPFTGIVTRAYYEVFWLVFTGFTSSYLMLARSLLLTFHPSKMLKTVLQHFGHLMEATKPVFGVLILEIDGIGYG